jgi:hypothetical protein
MSSIGHPGQSSPIPPVHSALQNRRSLAAPPGVQASRQFQGDAFRRSGFSRDSAWLGTAPGCFAVSALTALVSKTDAAVDFDAIAAEAAPTDVMVYGRAIFP